MTQATHLRSRAEVIGYSEPVLEAFRDLVHEIQADPVLAFGTGQMMDALKPLFAVERDGRPSDLYALMAALVIAAAEATQ